MNGTTSPDLESASNANRPDNAVGNASEQAIHTVDATGATKIANKTINEEAESEAETLIDSPVKKSKETNKSNAEAAAANANVKHESVKEKQTQDLDLDDSADAPGSPIDEEEQDMVVVKTQQNDEGSSDDELSDVSDHQESPSSSRASSISREASEVPNGTRASPNPRKRKHRASSVSLPNKRQSIDGTRRRLRASEARDTADNDRSDSPKNRSHRRAVSTQSFLDGNGDTGSSRKRRAAPQLSSRESKQARWEESSVSSEATSHGQGEQKRQRGVVRYTAGVGRPVGREHKRHVNKYGFTRLAEACEAGDVELAKEWREKDPEQLEIAEFAGNKPLQIAALNGNAEVVEYLISEGCNVDCANVDKDTPLIDAAENGHIDVVRILLKAGVDPLRQNLKGQQALDVVADDTDNATEIRAALRNAIETWNSVDAKQRREEEEVQRYRAGPAKELHFMARTYENLLRLVTINDRNGVREFLDARVPVDNAIIAAAAKTGDMYLINMLLAEMTEKKRSQKAEKPMLSVLGTSHFEMVKSLTELEQFNPLWTNRQGKGWSEIAEERAGPMWRQEVELLQELEREAQKKQPDRRSSSPIMRRSDPASGKHKRATEKEEDNANVGSDEDMIDKSDDDDNATRRKSGRRLVSRKDMQAASKRGDDKDQLNSDESEAENDSSDAAEHKKAASPKRGPGRPRNNKSTALKREEIKETAAKRTETHQRQSSSSKQGNASSDQVPDAESPLTEIPINKGEEQRPKVQDNSLQKRKMADHAATLEAARLKAEQEQAQRERLQKEQEAQEEARRQKEIEREQQRQRELEAAAAAAAAAAALEDARNQTRQSVLDSLPETLAYLLNPVSDFSIEEKGASREIFERCMPLEVIYRSDLGATGPEGPNSEPLVLNLTAAPLFGPDLGLQLLLPDDAMNPTVREALIAQGLLPGLDIPSSVRQCLHLLLHSSNLLKPASQQEAFIPNGVRHNAYAEELRQRAATLAAREQYVQQLHASPVALRWLPLQQVIDRLHPSLRYQNIEVREQWRNIIRSSSSTAHKTTIAEDFFTGVCQEWEHSGNAFSCRFAEKLSSKLTRGHRGRTAIHVITSK